MKVVLVFYFLAFYPKRILLCPVTYTTRRGFSEQIEDIFDSNSVVGSEWVRKPNAYIRSDYLNFRVHPSFQNVKIYWFKKQKKLRKFRVSGILKLKSSMNIYNNIREYINTILKNTWSCRLFLLIGMDNNYEFWTNCLKRQIPRRQFYIGFRCT